MAAAYGPVRGHHTYGERQIVQLSIRRLAKHNSSRQNVITPLTRPDREPPKVVPVVLVICPAAASVIVASGLPKFV